MIFLKFSHPLSFSVEEINILKDIISNHNKQSEIAAVVFPISSDTVNSLKQMAVMALNREDNYMRYFDEVEKQYIDFIKELIFPKNQSRVLADFKSISNDLADVLKGIYLLRELSAKTYENLVSFAGVFSTVIVSAYLRQNNIHCIHKNINEIISWKNNVVNMDKTKKQFFGCFSQNRIIVTSAVWKNQNNDNLYDDTNNTIAILADATYARKIEILTESETDIEDVLFFKQKHIPVDIKNISCLENVTIHVSN